MKTDVKNYCGIDLIKFFMAIIVVAIHTHPLEHCSNEILIRIYNSIVSSAVPFFFISSGFLLGSKLKKDVADFMSCHQTALMSCL